MSQLEDGALAPVWRRLLKPALSVLVPATIVVVFGIVGSIIAPDDQRPIYDNIHWTASHLAAALLAWIGVRYAPRPNRVKSWFAWALSCYAIGQLLWDVQVAQGHNPFPYYSDLFYVQLAPIYAIGMVRYLRRNHIEMASALLDIAGLSIAFLSLTLAIYVPRQEDHTLLQMVVLVAYPVGYFVATAAMLVSVIRMQLRPHVGWILSLCCLLLNTLLWLRWNVETLDNSSSSDYLFHALFSVAALGLGVGAMTLRGDPSESRNWRRSCRWVSRILPLFTVSASAVAVIIASAMPALRDYRVVVLPGFAIAVVMAAFRQSMSLTERERFLDARRQLSEAEDRNRMILENALDAIISMDATGRISGWNPVAEQIFGYSFDEAYGESISQLIVPPGLREEHLAAIAEFLRTRSPKILGKTIETVAMRKGGETFPIEISVSVSETPHGPFFSAFIRDITKRVESERQRLDLEAQLRHSQKMEAVGTLAAGIAHDFNNVLASIRGNAELAAEDLDATHPAKASVDEIRRAGLRAAHLVQQIVAFSRREKSTKMLPVQVAEVAYEVARLLRSTLPPTIEITVDAEADLPEVLADPGQIHQVLLNLCTNAWQAIGSRPGRIEMHLARRYARDRFQGIRIRVKDNGSGMSQEVAERIFEPFFTTKRLGEGTGLGLSVVHNIIESHGGEIRVNSQEGIGSELIVDLPTIATTAKEEAPASGRPVEGSLTAKLAYIDDEDSLLLLIRRALGRKGHTVTGYISASEAIADILADPHRFDIVVTDLNMPEMSGLEVARRIKAQLPNFPVLLTSGYVSDQVFKDASDAGIDKVIEKPNTMDDLCQAIQDILVELDGQRMLK